MSDYLCEQCMQPCGSRQWHVATHSTRSRYAWWHFDGDCCIRRGALLFTEHSARRLAESLADHWRECGHMKALICHVESQSKDHIVIPPRKRGIRKLPKWAPDSMLFFARVCDPRMLP